MRRTFIILAVCCMTTPLFAGKLKPESVEQFFVTPGTKAVIRFQLTGNEKPETLAFRLYGPNITATKVKTIPAVVAGNTVSVTVKLPRGFWELEQGAQRFGIVSLPAFSGNPDKFFAIDAGLSWLVEDYHLRAGLVKAARRNGIAMARERLSWREIEPAPGQFDWDTRRRYDVVRKLWQEHGIEVLEVFHNAPRWMERVEIYPGDLIQTAKSWDTIAAHWHTDWSALELWNEPNIFFGGDLPADQYVSMARAIAYQWKQSNIPTPLFGGVMAGFNPSWFKNAVDNGLLHDVDGFSFHSYEPATELEAQIGEFRNGLAEAGHEAMPLWLTESGRFHSWKGAERPPADLDLIIAADLAMKGVESRACGVERYFPFVYTYCEEGENNFGMTDKLGTPCRTLAAYAQSILALSGSEYAGDLNIDNPAVVRARVFKPSARKHNRNELIAVLYTGTLTAPQTLEIPAGKIKRVESVLGEPLKLPDSGELPIQSNSLYYVWLDGASLHSPLNTATEAMKLLQSAKKPGKPAEDIPPVIVRFQYDKEKTALAWTSYHVPYNAENPLPLTFRVFNLSAEEKTYKLRFEIDQITDSLTGVVVAGQGYTDVQWNLPLEKDKPFESDELQTLRVTVDGNNKRPLVLNLTKGAGWDDFDSTVKDVREIPILDLSRWHKNTPDADTVAIDTDGNLLRATAAFDPEGERRFHPRFRLPGDIDLSNASGIIIEARCTGDTDQRFFLFEKSGAGYISNFFKADGLWHIAKLRFAHDFQYEKPNPPDDNSRLDLDEIEYLSFGTNSRCREPEFTIEIRRIAVYYE
jgi:hypothetical protein